MKTNKNYYLITIFLLSLAVGVLLGRTLINNNDTRASQLPNNEEYKLERLIAEETQKHDDLRESILAWALAVVGVIIVIPGVLLSYQVHQEIKEFRTKSEDMLAGISKAKDEIFSEFREKTEAFSIRIGNIEPELKKWELSLDSTQISFLQDRNIEGDPTFSKLLNYYRMSRDSISVIKALEELLNDPAKISQRHQIYHYLGYIYNDEELLSSLNYTQAKKYFDLYLEIDPRYETNSIYLVLNDLAWAEMKLAENETDVTHKKELLNNAETHLKDSIKIATERNIRWPNSYKNMGYLLGKMAMSDNETERSVSFIRSLGMYLTAFSLSRGKELEQVNILFQKTMADFTLSLKKPDITP